MKCEAWKCEECQVLLAQGESGPEIERHLSECPACRALAEELAANAAVLEALRSEVLPHIEIRMPRPRRVYPWAVVAAAAAAFVVGSLLPKPAAPPLPAPPAPAPPAVFTVPRPQPLKIKMLTPDPNVVIYWIVD
jgi:hypothetical protein